jgi:hypothetical protein
MVVGRPRLGIVRKDYRPGPVGRGAADVADAADVAAYATSSSGGSR